MERLSILTLNIWNRQGPWERRLAMIRDALRELSPDVVALQEVLAMEGGGSQADEIAEGLGYEVYYSPGWTIGGGLEFGNAVLSRYPILESSTFALEVRPKDLGRGCGYCLIDAPCGRVPVFATHLSWKLHDAVTRIRQVRTIADRIKETCPLDRFPPVLAGDMNADPDSDEMRFLRGLTSIDGTSVYFADCWEACGEGPGHTYARTNAYALRSREPSRRIDYIYVRGPDRQLRGEPLVARLVLDEPDDGVFPSDHYGLYVEIQAAARPLYRL